MGFYRLLVPLGLLLLSGCSNNSLSTLDTLQYAFFGTPDVQISAEEVRRMPYASAYLQVGDNPQAFVVLAFADPDGTLTWVSADHNLFVTRAGRLIKTVGLENDLYRLAPSPDPGAAQRQGSDAAQPADPLARLAHLLPLARQQPADAAAALQPWQLQAEWQRDYVSGDTLRAGAYQLHADTLTVLDNTYSVWVIEERIEMLERKQRWHNRYWVDRESGRLLKSEQQLGPDMPVITMTILKPYSK